MKKYLTYLTYLLLLIPGLILLLTYSPIIYSQISQQVGLSATDGAGKWVGVKDIASFGADNATTGILANGLMLYDGTNFDRARGDTTNGLDVDVTRVSGSVTVIGNNTPADNYTTPTDALDAGSFLMLYDGTTWDMARNTTHGDNITTTLGLNAAAVNYLFDGTNYDRWLSSTHGDNLTTASGGNVASFEYGFDGTNWDRLLKSVHGDSITTASGLNVASILYGFDGTNYDRLKTSNAEDLTTGVLASGTYGWDGSGWDKVWTKQGTIGVPTLLRTFPHTINEYNNQITTNTSTVITSGNMPIITKIIVNVAGTTSTVAIYEDTSAPCDTGYAFTLPTATTGVIHDIDFLADTAGFCVLTAGAAAANITVLHN